MARIKTEGQQRSSALALYRTLTDDIGARLTGHTTVVWSVAFDPGGNRIVSGSFDGTLRLRPTYPDPVSVMCAKLTANMSHKQWRDWVSPDIDYIKVCPDLAVARTKFPR